MTAYWQALRWSAWLGWRVDSNWTTPWLFVVFVLVNLIVDVSYAFLDPRVRVSS